MNDRDHFAAAALTGLIANGDYGMDFVPVLAYELADAMLRERERTNHDAAPAARAREATASPERVRVRGDAGTGDTRSVDAYARFAGTVMDWISEATSAYASSCRSDGGREIMAEACSRCWDAFDRIAYPTIHGASPEARASVDSVAPQPTAHGDSDRTDKAAPRPSEGTGDTPVTEPMPVFVSGSGSVTPVSYEKGDEKRVDWRTNRDTTQPRNGTPAECRLPREGTKPVAWAVVCGDCVDSAFTDRDKAVEWACGLIPPPQIVPLYRSPTLTDAEREAIYRASQYLSQNDVFDGMAEDAAILRGLLERLGGNDA